jgi:hypothetical protein
MRVLTCVMALTLIWAPAGHLAANGTSRATITIRAHVPVRLSIEPAAVSSGSSAGGYCIQTNSGLRAYTVNASLQSGKEAKASWSPGYGRRAAPLHSREAAEFVTASRRGCTAESMAQLVVSPPEGKTDQLLLIIGAP